MSKLAEIPVKNQASIELRTDVQELITAHITTITDRFEKHRWAVIAEMLPEYCEEQLGLLFAVLTTLDTSKGRRVTTSVLYVAPGDYIELRRQVQRVTHVKHCDGYIRILCKDDGATFAPSDMVVTVVPL